jgi:tol-pal system protein YbgF
MKSRHAHPVIGLRRLLAVAAGLMILGLPLAAAAQDADVYAMADQLNRLQRDVADLQRQVYASGAGSAGAAVGSGSAVANQEVRLQQMDDQIRSLTGQVEQLSFKLQQVTTRLDKLAGDVDYRLRAIEEGGQAAAGPGNAPQVAGAPPGAAPAGGGTAPGTPPAPGAKSMVLGTLTQDQLNAGQPPAGGGQTAALAPAVTLPGNTPEEKYNYAFGLLRQASYPEAEQALRAFVQQYPNDKLAGNAQYWLGESFYVRGNYNDAALAFAEGYQKYPTNVKAPQNLLKLAMSLTAMGRKPDACKAFDQLSRQFPTAPADVKLRAGRERQNAGCPGA